MTIAATRHYGLVHAAPHLGIVRRGAVVALALICATFLSPHGRAAEPKSSGPVVLAQSPPSLPATKIEIVPSVGHTSPGLWPEISSATLSPDGKFILSTASDRTMRLWDTASSALIRIFKGHTAGLSASAISPDGREAVSASADKTLKLWDLSSGALVRTFKGHTSGVTAVTFSADGQTILSASHDNTVRLWRKDTGQIIRTLKGHTRTIRHVALSSDGSRALSSSEDTTARLWDTRTGATLKIFKHPRPSGAATFSPDGRFIATGASDGVIRLWDPALGDQPTLAWNAHASGWEISALVFSADGTMIASGSYDLRLRIWGTNGQLLRELGERQSPVILASFPADGKALFSVTRRSTIDFWDLSTGLVTRKLDISAAITRSIDLSPGGGQILSGATDGQLKLWDAANGRMLRTISGHAKSVLKVTFSPDGKMFASGGMDNDVKLWSTSTGDLVHTLLGHDHWINALAFSPDGRFLMSGAGGKDTLRLWDTSTGQIVRILSGETGTVNAAAYSPDGRYILSANGEGSLRLWDVTTGNLVRTFKGLRARPDFKDDTEGSGGVRFSPDGRKIVSVGLGSTIRVWDVATGRLMKNFKSNSTYVSSVAFTPDGQQIVSADEDGFLKLWDAESGTLVRTFEGHSFWATSLAITPDGRSIVSGGGDSTLKIWDKHSGSLRATIIPSPAGHWATVLPEGFLSASSPKAADIFSIVRGLHITKIDQVYQSLFEPDLVRDRLTGDPDGAVAKAASVMQLERVLDSGAPPAVSLVSPRPGSSASDVVNAEARIVDRGGGVGRIEWRVNGMTVGVAAASSASRPGAAINQAISLDPGTNLIEVVAYNARNLLASSPAQARVEWTGTSASRPKLYILAIGINTYRDELFKPLSLAAADARAFGEAMKRAGSSLYASTEVTYAIDADATAARLDATFSQLGKRIGPRETFVLFAAGHGVSINGRFYLIPQDYRTTDANYQLSIARTAVGQDKLQDWIANRIKAKKALILLDTCESGALVGGSNLARADFSLSEAAIGRLHEATGRPVLTAAAEGKPAFEGYRGHGVFTWAVLDALAAGDINRNGVIELSELAAHVQDLVPALSAELEGRGRAVNVAPPAANRQSARFGSRGEDFPFVTRLSSPAVARGQ